MSVEADARELNEKFLVRFRQIYCAGAVRSNDIPAKFEIVNRQTELGREHVHCADWQKAERRSSAGQSVHHLVDCAIASRSHNFFETFFYAASRDQLGFASAGRGADNTIARQRFNVRPFSLGALAVRGRIKNNQGATSHLSRFRFIFSSNMVCVTSPRAKIRPPRIYFHRRIVDPWGGPFSGPQPVCAITRDTSEDPAGTSPTLWRDLKNWTHERYAMEWFEAQWHHHRAGNDRHWR